MKPIIMACWMAAICVTTAAAQSTTETTRTKTKVKVDAARRSLSSEYALVGGDDIAKHLGRHIEVKGKATDSDHGKSRSSRKKLFLRP